MTAKHTFQPGQEINGYIVRSAADSRGGHARWDVACTSCGKLTTLRASRLASRTPCKCAAPAAAPTPAAAPATPAHDSAQLAELLLRVEKLEKQVEALQPKPKSTGIKSFSLAPKRVPLTRELILQDWPDLPPAERLQKSVLRAKVLAEMGKERTQELTWELKDRLDIERADIEDDPDIENAACRRAFVDLIYDLDDTI